MEWLQQCVNEDAPQLFKAFIACGLASHQLGKTEDEVSELLDQYIEQNTQESGTLTPPPLEVRFAFVRRPDGIHGVTYSTILGTAVGLDELEALKCTPGYVTPGLFTAPPHPNNPYAGAKGPWTLLQVGPVKTTAAIDLETDRAVCLDSALLNINVNHEQRKTPLETLHEAVKWLRFLAGMNKDDYIDGHLRWSKIGIFDGHDGDEFPDFEDWISVDIDDLIEQTKVIKAFGMFLLPLHVTPFLCIADSSRF
jgi:hypothetical protein